VSKPATSVMREIEETIPCEKKFPPVIGFENMPITGLCKMPKLFELYGTKMVRIVEGLICGNVADG